MSSSSEEAESVSSLGSFDSSDVASTSMEMARRVDCIRQRLPALSLLKSTTAFRVHQSFALASTEHAECSHIGNLNDWVLLRFRESALSACTFDIEAKNV